MHPIEIEKGIFIFSSILEKYNIRFILYSQNESKNVYKYKRKWKDSLESANLYNLKIIKYRAVDEKYYNLIITKAKYFNTNTLFISQKRISLFNNYKYKYKYKLLFCLTTFFNYNNSNRFIEFIEYYINFGVDKFIVYNTDCSNEIITIQNYYSKINIMDIICDNISHNLNGKNKFQVWKQNDCFHRYKYYAKRIIFHDHDEIIYSPVYNNSKLLFATLNKQATIYQFYPKLTITHGKGFFVNGFYSICPKDLWKFIINKSNCVDQVIIHDVILNSRKCFKESVAIDKAYVLHARNTAISKYCKNWTYLSNFNKQKILLDYQTKLIYSKIFNIHKEEITPHYEYMQFVYK